MPHPLSRKLNGFADFGETDQEALEKLFRHSITGRGGEVLIEEGDRPGHVHLLVEGWAYRYKLLPDGGRQILAYLIPGDLCDFQVFLLAEMDHSIGLLSEATIALIEPDEMHTLLTERPIIARALHWASMVDEAISREWLVNVARRDAYDRVAHLLCEMWYRMDAVGLVDHDRLSLPLTQAELGDTVGLTPVSVNRVLQRLRREGVITLRDRQLTILDVGRLKQIAGFNDNYLHRERRRPIR